MVDPEPARRAGFLKVDPAPLLVASSNAAIALFARRDLFDSGGESVAGLWDLPEPRRLVARQSHNGSWRYSGGKPSIRAQENYDQLETFRQLAILVEKFGFTRLHPSVERAAAYLLSFQTDEGDLRGIYGNQYATTYVGAILEVLIKAGYGDDPRIARALAWLLAMRQSDGGWAIPVRTVGVPFSEFIDVLRHPQPFAPDRSKPSSHLVTGMVLRAFAAHPAWPAAAEISAAGTLLATRLYQRDAYTDRGQISYWERVSFPFWFTDIVSSLDTLSRLGFGPETPTISAALSRVRELQRADGTFAFKLLRAKDKDLPWWICLAVCRILARW
ncbi:MAG: prenyltransferase/squalene oxidase repeat-containing protein [Solirubrobacteraceae bacterium]